MKGLVRDYYQLATTQTDPSATGFPDDAKDRLRQGRHVLDALPQDHGEARRFARQGDPPDLRRHRLEQTEGRAGAAQIIAEAENSATAYLALVQYASLAGDTRTADLAGIKAVDLAPGAREQVSAQVKQAKQAASAPQVQQGG